MIYCAPVAFGSSLAHFAGKQEKRHAGDAQVKIFARGITGNGAELIFQRLALDHMPHRPTEVVEGPTFPPMSFFTKHLEGENINFTANIVKNQVI
jgi:hypothetical protein